MDEVETLAYAAKAPWDGLASSVSTDSAGKQMLIEGDLDWENYKDPIKTTEGIEIPGWFAVRRRRQDGPDNVMGIVKQSFTCIQNEQIFSIPDVWVQEGRITYEAVGHLREGAIVYALGKMSEYEVKRLNGLGDHIERFLLWTAGHGNGRAVIGGFTDLRGACMNVLDHAPERLHGNIQNRFHIRHTKSAPERISEAHRILLKLDENGKRQQVVYQDLAMTPITMQQSKDFYSEWFVEEYGDLDKESKDFETRQAKRETTVAELLLNFTDSPGNTGETAWDTYNGLTYFLDHQRSRVRNATTRMNSILLGGQVYNQKGRAAKKLLAWTRDGKIKRVKS